MSTIAHSWLTTARTASRFRSTFWLCTGCSHRFFSKLCVKGEVMGQVLSCPEFMLTPTTENDIVLLKRRGNDDTKPILTKGLRPGGKIETHRGTIDHASLVGKEIRDVVYTTKGVSYRIHQPSLAEYVSLSSRVVTPVGPSICYSCD